MKDKSYILTCVGNLHLICTLAADFVQNLTNAQSIYHFVVIQNKSNTKNYVNAINGLEMCPKTSECDFID